MKTNLKQQLGLITRLEAEPSKPARIQMLRAWLRDNGYETIEDCKHHTLFRITGKCANCGVPVADPMPSGSDETIAVLRDRLRG